MTGSLKLAAWMGAHSPQGLGIAVLKELPLPVDRDRRERGVGSTGLSGANKTYPEAEIGLFKPVSRNWFLLVAGASWL